MFVAPKGSLRWAGSSPEKAMPCAQPALHSSLPWVTVLPAACTLPSLPWVTVLPAACTLPMHCVLDRRRGWQVRLNQ